MLHIITCSPFQCDFPAILRLISPGDDILLLEDGVILGIDGGITCSMFFDSMTVLYILREDLVARGLLRCISAHIQIITYDESVNLIIKNPKQISW
ncbi:sulfurtransferase complex subunit TusB [Candidatus Erwinia haradaeae]|uniref:Protein TusB n=1 Tax=Candidatus Erwinia haradaeae TaxID=1922217 RepID=A0A451D267_9GAMM|nr:sulfurtransferase complex subunit TusB [Candidatus Erwinia haradaeae]VFP79703.1 Protein TusB [Candidatus Erwinia haradaeae]